MQHEMILPSNESKNHVEKHIEKILPSNEPKNHVEKHVKKMEKAVTFSYDEVTDRDVSHTMEGSLHENNEQPASLEGVLYLRKGKSTGSSLFWKRRYVVLNFAEGGISCYRFSSRSSKDQGSSTYKPQKWSSVSKLHRRLSLSGEDEDTVALSLPASVPWKVQDIANDPSCFVIEIDTDAKNGEQATLASDVDVVTSSDKENDSVNVLCTDSNEDIFSGPDDIDYYDDSSDEKDEDDEPWQLERGSLSMDMEKAKGKPLRFYFRCQKGGNEKVLWLKAFSRMGRLSSGLRRKKFLLGSLKSKTAVRLMASRTRSASSAAFARESKHFETTTNQSSTPRVSINLNFSRVRSREKEHKVLPEHVYPNVWMTQTELLQEMEKPSEIFHDLRHNSSRLDLPKNPCKQPEVGTLQIECLQGLGFPKLDRYSQTDAVVYMVSGPYAFCTDVVKNRANPMWLAKTQRACTFPLHHAYARVYIGVFDDEKNEKDDFNGRIVLDVSRLRPNCTYDVSLPLRLSSHVYSRRKRGALRLRFRLQWHNLRSALFSYLDVPQRKNFKPNRDTVVACGSARAFRNVAITVHGAHLPGKFSFSLLRATLREINFTRKQIMTIFRQTIRGLRDWDNPLMSCFVFCAWMHCVYQNGISLVPAYVVFYLLLHLARNYARYGMDGPAQRGFIPPSWEEMFCGLLQNSTNNRAPAIQPLDMGYQTEIVNDNQIIKYNFETHEPTGKAVFRALGFMDEDDPDDNLKELGYSHLEFPFADGKVYPKFGVKDSLVVSKKKRKSGSPSGSRSQSPPSHGHGHFGMEMPKLLRKDMSGLYDYDDEEQRFATGKFIRKTGATSLKGAAHGLIDVGERAASGLIDVGGTLTEATGLQCVVSPITAGLQHYVVPPIKSGIKGGSHLATSGIKTSINGINYVATSGIKTSINGINYVAIQPLHHTVSSLRRSSHEFLGHDTADNESESVDEMREGVVGEAEADTSYEDFDADPSGAIMFSEWGDEDQYPLTPAAGTPSQLQFVPDQDIDFGGSSSNDKTQNRKRLTDDLVEVKEKFHELTLHKFNDSAYVVKDSNSRYFGCHNQRARKRRKVEVSRNLDKLLEIHEYSHANPVVARVGQYVEPMVGASHSFLCAFRALFNATTWKDPFLTFWVSIFGLALFLVLLVFPWRLFLFVLGVWFVGPHNWVIRILRKRRILPPKKPRSKMATPEDMPVPDDQVVFKGHITQDQKRKAHKQVHPREVQYVCVPYSQLMYQRFYDWPPEEDYAQVHPDEEPISSAPSNLSFATTPTASLESSGEAAFPTQNSFFSSTIALSEKKDQ